ncbi:MAG: SdrD B-like domain-containing protein [Chthoniobacteraceae bacterium]
MKTLNPTSLLKTAFIALCGVFTAAVTAIANPACVLPTAAQQATFNPRISIESPVGVNGIVSNATGSPASFIKATFVNIPPGYSITNNTPYLGWCVDAVGELIPADFNPAVIYKPVLFNSCDSAALAAAGLPTANWDKINYIINNKPLWASLGYNVSEIQAAIWRFIGFNAGEEASILSGTYGFGFPAGNVANVNAIVAVSTTNGTGFMPGVNQVTAVVVYLPGQGNPNGQLNFVEVLCLPPGSIGDTVFCDLNANGVQEAGDVGLQNVRVFLSCVTATGTVTAIQFTDHNGKYRFDGLAPGVCTVTVDQSTAPLTCNKTVPNCPLTRTVNLGPGQVYLDADFCFSPSLGSIGDTVFCDYNENGVQNSGEPGIQGVKVTLTCVTATGTVTKMAVTGVDGKYLFTDLAPGTCTVTIDPTTAPVECNRVIPNCPLSRSVTLAAGQVYLDADFCLAPRLGVIGDTVFCDLNGNGVQEAGDVGIPNVKVTIVCTPLAGGTVTAQMMTDSQGKYLFTNIQAGTCTVSVDKSTLPANCNVDVPNCPSTRTVVLGPGESNLDMDFCYTQPPCALQVAAFCTIPKPPGDGDDCNGSKVKSIKMVYTGLDCTFTSHTMDAGKVVCTDYVLPLPNSAFIRVSDNASPTASTAKVYFQGTVAKNGSFTAAASNVAGATQLPTNSYIHVLSSQGGTLLQQTLFHTSCSQDLAVGNQFGTSLVTELSFIDGRTVVLQSPNLEKNCTITQGGAAICPDGDKVKSVQLIYTKENCSFSANSQAAGKWLCVDYAPLLDNVFIRVTDKSSPTDTKAKVFFQGPVAKDAAFTAAAATVGATTLPSNIFVHIYNVQGGTRLQFLQIHTSCSTPLNAGDQFGSIIVFSADTVAAGTVSLGTEVKFIYKIANLGATTITNVNVTDFMGTVSGSPLTILPGQVVDLMRTVATSTNISNTVTASGGAGTCSDSDTTTVTVVPPPPTPKDCTAAIQKTLLKYTGPNVAGAVTVNFLGSSGATASYSFPGGLLSGTTLSLPSQNNWTIDSTVSGQSSLGTKLTITINGVAEVHHTSCSTPYRTGLPAPLDSPKGQPSTLWFVVDFVSKP